MAKKRFPLLQFPSINLQHTLPLLLFWIAIGAVLRFAQLAGKPPWTDEFATLVFSLGNDYQNVPLDQIISPSTLLQPLKMIPGVGVTDVFTNLITQDNHPPIYFILAHIWLEILPTGGEYVSVWIARSLPALLGVISIPAIYFLSLVTFRSRLVAHFSALILALSPYGIFLSQEARHYTLVTLFVIAGLTCLVAAIQRLSQGQTLPWWLIITWLIVNSLGFITHYFFTLTLLAQLLAILFLIWPKIKILPFSRFHNNLMTTPTHTLPPQWWRLLFVGFGTLIVSLAWVLIFIPENYGSGTTAWIKNDGFSFLSLINPPIQLFTTCLAMIYLLPVESSYLAAVIVSGLIMLFLLLFALPSLILQLKSKPKSHNILIGKKLLINFFMSAVIIFLSISYFFGIDITRGARYSFVYFPSLIVLFAASLAPWWKSQDIIPQPLGSFLLKKVGIKKLQVKGKRAVQIILLSIFLSSLTVIANLGYQKYYRPDLLVSLLQKNSNLPILIATTHISLVQTGEMMGIAWELKQKPSSQPVNFLLAHQDEPESPIATKTLQQETQNLPRPFELWTVNFHAPQELTNCVRKKQKLPHIDGYEYEVHQCKPLT